MSVKKKTSTRGVRDESKFEHAWLLYTQNLGQQEIAQRVGVSEKTINRWINDKGWKEKRAAKTITRDELVNKTLQLIDKLLTDTTDPGKNDRGLADQLSKLAGAIKNLDKQANVVDIIQVFIMFNGWLSCRQTIDSALTDELLKSINKYQDAFVNERLSSIKP